MARILIVGGEGGRGMRLAGALLAGGHAVRIVTRDEAGHAEAEAAGAEPFRGDPGRLSTLTAALEHVTVVCWLLADAAGAPGEVEALHAARLEQFLTRTIDSTVRGFVYEAGGGRLPAAVLERGERIVRNRARENALPAVVLRVDPGMGERWMQEAVAAVEGLLEGRFGVGGDGV